MAKGKRLSVAGRGKKRPVKVEYALRGSETHQVTYYKLLTEDFRIYFNYSQLGLARFLRLHLLLKKTSNRKVLSFFTPPAIREFKHALF